MTQQTLFKPAPPPPPPSPEELESARILALEESRKLAEQLSTREEHRLKDPVRHVATPLRSSADTLDELLPPGRELPELGPADVAAIRAMTGPLSQEKFGDLLGVDGPTIGRIERGKRPLTALEVGVLDLLREVLLAIPNETARAVWARAVAGQGALRAVMDICAAGAELGVSKRRASPRPGNAKTLLEARANRQGLGTELAEGEALEMVVLEVKTR